MTTPARVTIDGTLYDDILEALRGVHLPLTGRLLSVIEDDWCEDDGSGYCGNHDAYIRYLNADGADVCTSSNRYDAALDV